MRRVGSCIVVLGVVLGVELGSPTATNAQPRRTDWHPDVSLVVQAARSNFRGAYRADYQTDWAPMVTLTGYQRLGAGFAAGLGIQYFDQRVTGLGPILRYRFEYLEIPLTLTRALTWIGPVATELYGGGSLGIPLRCRGRSTVPGGAEAELRCGDSPIAVEDHRMAASLRLGATARVQAGGTWLGLTAGIQHGLNDVFGRARTTTLLVGAEIGR